MKTLILWCGLALVPAMAETVVSLESLVAEQDWRGARAYVERLSSRCERRGGDANCMLQARFSSAWLNTQMASSLPAGAQKIALLEAAKQDYVHILQQRPGHQASQDNLVLVLEALQDAEGLQNLLESQQDPQKVAEIAVSVAEMRKQKDNLAAALASFALAYDKLPSVDTATLLVEVFESQPSGRAGNKLFSLAQRHQTRDPEGSGLLYATIARHRDAVTEEVWDNAALSWTKIAASDRVLSPALIKQSFNLETSAVFRELYRRLQHPTLGAPRQESELGYSIMRTGDANGGWWTQDLAYSQALAMAGWSQGHLLALSGQIMQAQNMWLGALFYAPSQDYYWGELEGERGIALELMTDLARLQHLYKQVLDPEGRNFRILEGMLFGSKAGAYEVNDLHAIRRHHTVLGKLYADLGIFDNGYRGAEFQLRHAIETSEKIAQQQGRVAAEPLMASLLADGYNCALKQQRNCRKNTAQADQWYTQATQGFLDLDAIGQAQRSLDKVKAFKAVLSPAQQALGQVIQTRKALPKGNLSTSVQVGESASQHQWLVAGDARLPEAFVQRQQFKVLSDISLQGSAQTSAQSLQILQAAPVKTLAVDERRLKQMEKLQKMPVKKDGGR